MIFIILNVLILLGLSSNKYCCNLECFVFTLVIYKIYKIGIYLI